MVGMQRVVAAVKRGGDGVRHVRRRRGFQLVVTMLLLTTRERERERAEVRRRGFRV